MAELPSGTVTFLFTDIEGSTRLLNRLGHDAYEDMLAEHSRILLAAFAAHGGQVVDTQGDSFFVAFRKANDAVTAAADAQRDLAAHAWAEGAEVKVRMGLHTGEPKVGGERYVGIGVHRAARIGAAGHGGQVLLSWMTKGLAEEDLPPGVTIRDLGERRLKDIEQPQRLYQLVVEGLESEFAQLRTLDVELRSKRQRMYAGSALIGVLAAAVAIPVLALGQGGSGSGKGLARVDANAVGVIDPATNKIRTEAPVGITPSGVAAGDDAVWVANADDQSVSRIDPKTNTKVQTIQVGSEPSGIASGAGAVWVANSLGNTVTRIDPQTNTVVDEITVGNSPRSVVYGFGSVWVTNAGDATVSRINPASDKVVKTFGVGAGVSGIAAGAGALWVTSDSSGRVFKIDPRTDDLLQTIGVGNGPDAVAVGAGAVWVANEPDGTVSRIDPATGTVKGVIQVGNGPSGIATSKDAVWVSNEYAGTLSRIDPARGTVVRTVKTGNRPNGVALAGDSVYVAVRASVAAHRGGTLRLLLDLRAAGATLLLALDPDTGLFPPVYDGLVGYRYSGGSEGAQLVPDLAAALPSPTDGGKTYRFQLRRIRYSTGKLVRPADFRYGLEHKVLGGGNPGYLGGIVGAAACAQAKSAAGCDLSRGIVTDERRNTVTFHLLAPDPDFLYKLVWLDPVPAGTPLKLSPQHWLPGTGPYKVSTISADRAILVRNRHFRVWSASARPDGYPDRIVILQRTTEAAAVRAVLAGKADLTGVSARSSALWRELQTRYPSQIKAIPRLVTDYFRLNTRVPPFDDVRVRRAVNYAFDRAKAVRLRGGPKSSHLTCQILPLGMPGYQSYCPYTLNPNRSGTWSAPDLAQARRLIAASHKEGTRVTVYTCSGCYGKEVAPSVVSLLQRLGYKARLKVLPDKTYLGIIHDSRRKVQVADTGWSVDYPAASGATLLTLSCAAFHPAVANAWGNWNDAEFCDPRIDAQMRHAAATQITDPAAANALWARIDREITDQAPWLPFDNPQAIDIVSKRLGNYQHNFLGAILDQFWVR